MLKALVIFPPPKTCDVGDLLQICRAEAKKREHTSAALPILAIHYLPELHVYVAVYEVSEFASNNRVVQEPRCGRQR